MVLNSQYYKDSSLVADLQQGSANMEHWIYISLPHPDDHTTHKVGLVGVILTVLVVIISRSFISLHNQFCLNSLRLPLSV